MYVLNEQNEVQNIKMWYFRSTNHAKREVRLQLSSNYTYVFNKKWI